MLSWSVYILLPNKDCPKPLTKQTIRCFLLCLPFLKHEECLISWRWSISSLQLLHDVFCGEGEMRGKVRPFLAYNYSKRLEEVIFRFQTGKLRISKFFLNTDYFTYNIVYSEKSLT